MDLMALNGSFPRSVLIRGLKPLNGRQLAGRHGGDGLQHGRFLGSGKHRHRRLQHGRGSRRPERMQRPDGLEDGSITEHLSTRLHGRGDGRLSLIHI